MCRCSKFPEWHNNKCTINVFRYWSFSQTTVIISELPNKIFSRIRRLHQTMLKVPRKLKNLWKNNNGYRTKTAVTTVSLLEWIISLTNTVNRWQGLWDKLSIEIIWWLCVCDMVKRWQVTRKCGFCTEKRLKKEPVHSLLYRVCKYGFNGSFYYFIFEIKKWNLVIQKFWKEAMEHFGC